MHVCICIRTAAVVPLARFAGFATARVAIRRGLISPHVLPSLLLAPSLSLSVFRRVMNHFPTISLLTVTSTCSSYQYITAFAFPHVFTAVFIKSVLGVDAETTRATVVDRTRSTTPWMILHQRLELGLLQSFPATIMPQRANYLIVGCQRASESKQERLAFACKYLRSKVYVVRCHFMWKIARALPPDARHK